MAKKIKEYIKNLYFVYILISKVFKEFWIFFLILYTFSLYITDKNKDNYDFT
jgi:hypothetical protein